MSYDDDEIFLGREQQLAEFLSLLKTFFDDKPSCAIPPVMLIHGQGGIGKSTLLREYKALAQRNFPDEYHLLDIDWQLELQQNRQSFSGDPSKTDPRLIFQTINQRAGDCIDRWKPDSNEYVEATRKIHDVVNAMEAQFRNLGESARASLVTEGGLAGQAANAVGALTSLALGPLAKLVEPLTIALIKYGFSQLTPRVVAAMMPNLKQLDIDLLLRADQEMAHALGEALEQASKKRRLIVTFDTYEIIDELDPLLRVIIRSAGPRVAWVIAGRRDLFDTRPNTPVGRIDGYREENRQSHLVTSLDLKALALEDIRQYFRLAAPQRPTLDDEQVRRVDTATCAIPLAVKLAADIWNSTGDIAAIISTEGLTQDRIVDDMVSRYEQHCIDRELDRRTLGALAMADGDSQILKAMLIDEFDGSEDSYEEHMVRVRHRYSAVQRLSVREPRLHDEPAHFFRERLRLPDSRGHQWVMSFNERAIKWLCAQINERVEYHLSLQDLCEDDDYVAACTKVADHLFWLKEKMAMPWLIARYVEGIAYSAPLREGLLEVVRDWHPYLSALARKTFLVLQRSEEYPWLFGEQETRRNLLEGDAKRGWFSDGLIDNRFEQERQKIRLWSAAESLNLSGRYKEALVCVVEAAVGGVSTGLSKRIAATANSLSLEFYYKAKMSEEAKRSLQLAIEVEPDNSNNWLEMGAFLMGLNLREDANTFLREAIRLKPDDHVSWRVRGINYSELKQYDKAFECYETTIKLNPDDHMAWNAKGTDHQTLKDYEKAIECHEKATKLKPDYTEGWDSLGTDYSWLCQYEKATECYQKAIELKADYYASLRNLAWVMTFLDRYDDADQNLRRALDLKPDDASSLDLLGYLHMLRGNRDDAVKAFQSSISADDKRPSPHSLWARFLYRDNKFEPAAERFRIGLSVDPENQSALLGLPVVNRLIDHVNDPAWVQLTDQLVEKNLDPMVKAQWLAIRGSNDQAIERLSEAIVHTPNDATYALFCPAFHDLRTDPRFIALTHDIEGSTWP